MTRQRALLLELFSSGKACGHHRTAEEILALAKETMPDISRATVYNNLHSMESDGLIRRITGENGADVYDSSFDLHGHLICKCCNKISDIRTPQLYEELCDLVGERIDSYELKVRYLCDECKLKQTKTNF